MSRGVSVRNLLGKRVDYSGRSLSLSDPELKSVSVRPRPGEMALELFKPFVGRKGFRMKAIRIISKSAKRKVERAPGSLGCAGRSH